MADNKKIRFETLPDAKVVMCTVYGKYKPAKDEAFSILLGWAAANGILDSSEKHRFLAYYNAHRCEVETRKYFTAMVTVDKAYALEDDRLVMGFIKGGDYVSNLSGPTAADLWDTWGRLYQFIDGNQLINALEPTWYNEWIVEGGELVNFGPEAVVNLQSIKAGREEAEYAICGKKRFGSAAEWFLYLHKTYYPKFKFNDTCGVDEEAQRQMHEFLRGSIEKISEDPSVVGFEEEEKTAWENTKLRHVGRYFYELYSFLCELGNAGEITDNSLAVKKGRKLASFLPAFRQIGLRCDETGDAVLISSEEYPLLVSAWKALSSGTKVGMSSTPAYDFLFGRYDKEQIWTATELYSGIAVDKGALAGFEAFMQSKGYTCANDGLTVRWSKQYPGNVRGEMSAEPFAGAKDRILYNFEIPNFKNVLINFDLLGDELKGYIAAKAKNCDQCSWCENTGEKPLQSVAVKIDGRVVEKCGFGMYWAPVWASYDLGEQELAIFKALFEAGERFANETAAE